MVIDSVNLPDRVYFAKSKEFFFSTIVDDFEVIEADYTTYDIGFNSRKIKPHVFKIRSLDVEFVFDVFYVFNDRLRKFSDGNTFDSIFNSEFIIRSSSIKSFDLNFNLHDYVNGIDYNQLIDLNETQKKF
jgi:hypothetical protein